MLKVKSRSPSEFVCPSRRPPFPRVLSLPSSRKEEGNLEARLHLACILSFIASCKKALSDQAGSLGGTNNNRKKTEQARYSYSAYQFVTFPCTKKIQNAAKTLITNLNPALSSLMESTHSNDFFFFMFRESSLS